MENNYKFRLLINVEETDDESLVSISYPKDRTIGELREFIIQRLSREGLEGEIYYLENEFNRELTEEYQLGGVLFPNDIPILDSMIENHTIFYAQCHEIEEEEEEEETINSSTFSPFSSLSTNMAQYLMERMSRTSNSLNSLTTLSNMLSETTLNSNLDVLLNGINRNLNFNINSSSNITPTIISTSGISGTTSVNINGLTISGTAGNGLNRQLFISYLHPGESMNSFNSLINMMGALGSMTPNRMEDVPVGLHKDDLEALRVNLHKNFETKDKCDTCAICIDKFKEEDVCRELKCQHLFHKDCIDHWLDTNIKCPVCRMETGRGVPKL